MFSIFRGEICHLEIDRLIEYLIHTSVTDLTLAHEGEYDLCTEYRVKPYGVINHHRQKVLQKHAYDFDLSTRTLSASKEQFYH